MLGNRERDKEHMMEDIKVYRGQSANLVAKRKLGVSGEALLDTLRGSGGSGILVHWGTGVTLTREIRAAPFGVYRFFNMATDFPPNLGAKADPEKYVVVYYGAGPGPVLGQFDAGQSAKAILDELKQGLRRGNLLDPENYLLTEDDSDLGAGAYHFVNPVIDEPQPVNPSTMSESNLAILTQSMNQEMKDVSGETFLSKYPGSEQVKEEVKAARRAVQPFVWNSCHETKHMPAFQSLWTRVVPLPAALKMVDVTDNLGFLNLQSKVLPVKIRGTTDFAFVVDIPGQGEMDVVKAVVGVLDIAKPKNMSKKRIAVPTQVICANQLSDLPVLGLATDWNQRAMLSRIEPKEQVMIRCRCSPEEGLTAMLCHLREMSSAVLTVAQSGGDIPSLPEGLQNKLFFSQSPAARTLRRLARLELESDNPSSSARSLRAVFDDHQTSSSDRSEQCLLETDEELDSLENASLSQEGKLPEDPDAALLSLGGLVIDEQQEAGPSSSLPAAQGTGNEAGAPEQEGSSQKGSGKARKRGAADDAGKKIENKGPKKESPGSSNGPWVGRTRASAKLVQDSASKRGQELGAKKSDKQSGAAQRKGKNRPLHAPDCFDRAVLEPLVHNVDQGGRKTRASTLAEGKSETQKKQSLKDAVLLGALYQIPSNEQVRQWLERNLSSKGCRIREPS